MGNLKIDYSCIGEQSLMRLGFTGEIVSSSLPVAWCMLATGINRIFTRDHFAELCYRMALVLQKTDLMEQWFAHGRLMAYTVNGMTDYLQFEDLLDHTGLEVVDDLDDVQPWNRFKDSLSFNMSTAVMIGQMENMILVPFGNPDNENVSDIVNRLMPEITEEQMKRASLFAEDLLKNVPENFYDRKNKNIIEKEKELAARREAVLKLPKFSMSLLSDEMVMQCLNTFYMPEFAESVKNDPKAFADHGEPMIYLAWLWANGFIISDDYGTRPVEGFYIDDLKYELEDGGVNLMVTIGEHNMDELVPLPKGLF